MVRLHLAELSGYLHLLINRNFKHNAYRTPASDSKLITKLPLSRLAVSSVFLCLSRELQCQRLRVLKQRHEVNEHLKTKLRTSLPEIAGPSPPDVEPHVASLDLSIIQTNSKSPFREVISATARWCRKRSGRR